MKHKTIFQKIVYVITFPFLFVVKSFIYFYKKCISPLLNTGCKFCPSCSTYFLQALDEYGFFKGFCLGTKRIFRCNPFSKGGLDPVKPNIKGKIKWIL